MRGRCTHWIFPFIRRWEGAFRHHSQIVAATAVRIRAPPHHRGEVFRISVGRKSKPVSPEVAEHSPPWLLQSAASTGAVNKTSGSRGGTAALRVNWLSAAGALRSPITGSAHHLRRLMEKLQGQDGGDIGSRFKSPLDPRGGCPGVIPTEDYINIGAKLVIIHQDQNLSGWPSVASKYCCAAAQMSLLQINWNGWTQQHQRI